MRIENTSMIRNLYDYISIHHALNNATIVVILLLWFMIWTINFHGKLLFYIKTYFHIKKSRTFIYIIKSLLSIAVVYFIWKFFGKDLSNIEIKHESSSLPISITLSGFTITMITFYKTSQKNKLDNQMNQFYKLLDMLRIEVTDKNNEIDKSLLFISEQVKKSKEHEWNQLFKFVVLNTRIKQHAIILNIKYHWYFFKFKRYTQKNNILSANDIRIAKSFINTINIFDNIQNSFAKSIPTNSQLKFIRILLSYTINNDSQYIHFKEYATDSAIKINPDIYSALDSIGYIKYFSTFLPKFPEHKNEAWKYDVKNIYIETFMAINKSIKNNQNVLISQ